MHSNSQRNDLIHRYRQREQEEDDTEGERNKDDALVFEERERERAKRKENCRLQSIFAACARMLRVFCYDH